MEVLEMDDSDIQRDTMMCSDCGLPLFQKDERMKFFLFCCRGCGHEVHLDFEFSWERFRINQISILPKVKLQSGDTCAPNAIVTAVECSIKSRYAKEGKVFKNDLSADDLIKQHEDRMGPDFTWSSNGKSESKTSRSKMLRQTMETNGVLSDKDFKSSKKSGTRYKARSNRTDDPSFTYSCNKIMQGSVLYTSIRTYPRFNDLDGDKIYTSDHVEEIGETDGPIRHAIVLVGFGMKDNVKFFRFLNSHGIQFGRKGFGSVHANEISAVVSFEPLI